MWTPESYVPRVRVTSLACDVSGDLVIYEDLKAVRYGEHKPGTTGSTADVAAAQTQMKIFRQERGMSPDNSYNSPKRLWKLWRGDNWVGTVNSNNLGLTTAQRHGIEAVPDMHSHYTPFGTVLGRSMPTLPALMKLRTPPAWHRKVTQQATPSPIRICTTVTAGATPDKPSGHLKAQKHRSTPTLNALGLPGQCVYALTQYLGRA